MKRPRKTRRRTMLRAERKALLNPQMRTHPQRRRQSQKPLMQQVSRPVTQVGVTARPLLTAPQNHPVTIQRRPAQQETVLRQQTVALRQGMLAVVTLRQMQVVHRQNRARIPAPPKTRDQPARAVRVAAKRQVPMRGREQRTRAARVQASQRVMRLQGVPVAPRLFQGVTLVQAGPLQVTPRVPAVRRAVIRRAHQRQRPVRPAPVPPPRQIRVRRNLPINRPQHQIKQGLSQPQRPRHRAPERRTPRKLSSPCNPSSSKRRKSPLLIIPLKRCLIS